MSHIKETIWQLEPHTEAKHAILRKYLDAWLPIISRYNANIVYIDGFAGPGEYIGGKDGSPLIAIKAIMDHKIKISSRVLLLFIEKDKARFDHLKTKLEALSLPDNIKVSPVNDEFRNILNSIFKHLDDQKKTLAPSFVFIDPFGFTGIPLEIIKRIMAYPKCEVLITFMYDELNHFVNDRLTKGLDETFATEEWKGVQNIKDPASRQQFLHGLYYKQLREFAQIKHVLSFKMKSKANRTDYFLFFGTNSQSGLEKMKEAMWRVDESGSFVFSDANFNPDQTVLFQKSPDLTRLQKATLDEFKDRPAKVKEILDFVLLNTPFLPKHLRQVLQQMEKQNKDNIKRQCDNCTPPGKCKKSHFFPDYCIIKMK